MNLQCAFRDADAKELKERCGVRDVAQAPPPYDSASAGMVEKSIRQVKEKVRSLVIAAREVHGVVMNAEHVALSWCVRFAGQIVSLTEKGRAGLTVLRRAYQRKSRPRATLAAGARKFFTWTPQRRRYSPRTYYLMGSLEHRLVCLLVPNCQPTAS